MTDRRNPQIMALIVELAESSPPAPSYRELEEQVGPPALEVKHRPDSRPKIPGWVYGVAAALAVLLAIGGIALFLGDVDEVPPADQTTVPPVQNTVPDGQGMGDPNTWSWTVLEEPVPDIIMSEIMSDGRHLYGFSSWPDPFAVWSSIDGSTWQSILDEAEEVLPPIEQIALSDGRGLVVLASLTKTRSWDGVAANPPTIVVFDSDGRVETTEFRPLPPESPSDYTNTAVSAAAIGPAGAVIWTTAILDEHAIAREAFDGEFTESQVEAIRESCPGCDLVPEIGEETISLERVLGDGSVEHIAGPVPLADLGIDEEFLRERSLIWHSADGQSWRSVPAPAFLAEEELDGVGPAAAEMVGIEDGFVLVLEGDFDDRGAVMYSSDGIDWVELAGVDANELVPWLGQAVVWGEDFWRVTSAGVERLPLSDGPDPIDISGPFVGAGEAGLLYLHEHGFVYSPDGHSWGSAPIPEDLSELIDTDSLWWGPQPWVGRDAILLHATPMPDEPYSLLQATAGNR